MASVARAVSPSASPPSFTRALDSKRFDRGAQAAVAGARLEKLRVRLALELREAIVEHVLEEARHEIPPVVADEALALFRPLAIRSTDDE